jgi:hypothetical protein
VTQLKRFAQRKFKDLLRTRRKGDVPGRSLTAVADDFLDLRADSFQRDAERLEGLRGNSLTLMNQAEQDVLGPDVVVVQEPRFLLGEDDDPAGTVGEALEQGKTNFLAEG